MQIPWFHQISECAPANLLVWISPFAIEEIITVLHLEDVVNQVYSPVCDRVLTFFTTSNAIFDYPGGNDDHDLISVESHDHFAFGPSTRHLKPWNITETERQTESKFRINRMGQKLLTNMRNIGGIDRASEFMSRGTWINIVSDLSNLCPSLIPKEQADAICKQTKQVVIHGTLSLESKHLPTRQVCITTRNSTQLATLWSYFSSTFGVGIRKRVSSLKYADIVDGISYLQCGDIIHMVDIDLSSQEDASLDEAWLSAEAVHTETVYQPHHNFIRLKYDTCIHQLTLTFKALALNAKKLWCRSSTCLHAEERYHMV